MKKKKITNDLLNVLIMAYVITYPDDNCENNVPAYQCTVCPDLEKAGISSVALIRNGFVFMDRTDPAEWTTGIENGDILFIPRTRGNYDGGAAKYGEGYGRVKQRLLGYDYKLQFKDEDFRHNADFYDAIDDSTSWTLAWFTETLVWFSLAKVTVAVKDPVDEDIEKDVIWDCEVSWFYKDKPLKVTAPVGIAESCFTLSSESGS
jgi:hypothetical protein